MKFGAHVSITGGIEKAPERIHKIGGECFQFFSRSPQGGKTKELTPEIIDKFKANCRKYNLKNYYIHTPYYINLASANNRIYYGSIAAIKEELKRADLLGAKAVITHLGSAKELDEKEARKKLVEGLKKVFLKNPPYPPLRKGEEIIPPLKKGGEIIPPLKKGVRGISEEYPFKTQLLLEITAGAGNIMGDNFEEIAYFIREAEKGILKNKLGVCFDTAHAFESGYDLRTKKAVQKTFNDFDKIIGLKRLKLVHANDSKTDLNSHIDRHENLGYGKIGLECFKAIVSDPRLNHLDLILETPPSEKRNDLEVLKGMKT